MKHTLLKERYQETALPMLQKELGHSSIMAVPRILKVTVNCGVGRIRDDKQHEIIKRALGLITGQRPAPRPAKKAIASFKTRKGLVVGFQSTLRGRRMWDFLERLVAIAIPRQRDFRGIDRTSVDHAGNLTIGFKEHIVFPEMIGEDIPFIFGFEVTITTNAKRREDGIRLFEALGFPLKLNHG